MLWIMVVISGAQHGTSVIKTPPKYDVRYPKSRPEIASIGNGFIRV
jgi:hypothetical protein